MPASYLALAVFVLLVVAAAVWLLRGRGPSAGAERSRADGLTRMRSVAPTGLPVVEREDAATTRDRDVSVGSQTTRDIFKALYAVAFDSEAVDDSTVATRSGHAEVVAGSVATLSGIESQPAYIPRRPQVLPQLMDAVNDPESGVREITRIITQDPALAGNLLRIANSPLYRVQPDPVESIERAATLVGTEGIRWIIAAAVVQPVMDSNHGAFGRFPAIIWEHTLLSAVAAAAHAKQIEHADGFAAQLLGLLQGLGSIIVVRVVRDEYAKHPGVRPDASVAAALLEAWAGSTARRIAESWGLSERIANALHDQMLGESTAELSPLGRSLRFGRIAGALAMLCKLGRMDEAQALPILVELENDSQTTLRIWGRLQPREPIAA